MATVLVLTMTIAIGLLSGIMAEKLGVSDSDAGKVALCAAGIAFCLFVAVSGIVHEVLYNLRDEIIASARGRDDLKRKGE